MEFLNINPIFLFILFAMGYVFGLLIKNPSAGKFLIFGFAGIFIYEPVKDAGLLASAAFVVGIIIHHFNPLAILDSYQLYRTTKVLRNHFDQDNSQSGQGTGSGHHQQQQKNDETTEETYAKYEQHRREKQRQKAEHENAQQEKPKAEKKAKTQQKAEPSSSNNTERDRMHKEREDLKRQQDRLKADQENLRRQQAEASGANDTRTPEEVLGLKGEYTLAELKKAWRTEAARWHPDLLRNKPPHLVKQAEEELKKINTAFDVLKKKFD